MKLFRSPKALLIIAMISFGTIGPFVRAISLPSGELALYRAILASLLLIGYLLVKKQPVQFRSVKREAILLFASGAALAFNWILLFEAYKRTTVSTATLAYYFAPIIVTLVCPLLFKERMQARQWLCFAGSTAGIVLITGIGGEGTAHHTGVLLGLGAACLYATVILLNKYIKGIDSTHRTLLQFASATVVLLPYVALTDGFHLNTLNAGGWLCLLTVGLFHTGVTYCLYFAAIRSLNGQQTAILSYVDPLVAVILSVAVLGEAMSLPQIIGGVLILGCALWNELPHGIFNKKEKKENEKSK